MAWHESSRDRRARELKITDAERRTLRGITSAVEAAQKTMLRGLTEKVAKELVRLLQKAIAAGNDLSRLHYATRQQVECAWCWSRK